jgi:hypothetical protein
MAARQEVYSEGWGSRDGKYYPGAEEAGVEAEAEATEEEGEEEEATPGTSVSAVAAAEAAR